MMYQIEDDDDNVVQVESDGIMRNSNDDGASPPSASRAIIRSDNDSNQYHHTEMNPYHNTSHAIMSENKNSSVQSAINSSNGGGFCSSLFCCITGTGSGTAEGINSGTNGSNTTTTMVTRCTILFVLCNTIVIIVLFVLVMLMGLQIHTLETQLISDEKEIATLQTQITTQMNNQQHLNQRVDDEHSLTLYQMAGTFTLLTCLISIFHMTQHISNYYEPIIQRKIIAILWMSPIYSITSFLSLIFINVDPYLAVIKDCYEAYTIYTFLSFLIAVLGRGNRTVAIQVLSCHADQLHKPNRCLSFLYYPPPDTSPTAMATAVLTECQILAMQFVLVRPITSILTFVVDVVLLQTNNDDGITVGENDSPYTSYLSSPHLYIAIINNISVFFAFQGLLKFYHAVHLDLKWCQPFNKFVSIKSIVFLTFWQGLLISIFINVNHNSSSHQNTPMIHNPTTAVTVGQAIPTMSPMNPMLYPVPAPTVFYAPAVVPVTLQPLSSSSTANNVAVPSTTTNTKPSSSNSTRQHQQHWVRFLDEPTPTDDEAERDMDNDVNNNNEDEGSSSDTTDTLLNDNDNNNNQDTNDNTKNNNNDHYQSSKEHAAAIQNFLICFEMLLFAIGHWCVFPSEEWKPDYRPPTNYAKPGFGISDFAQDISDIVGNATQHHRRRRRRRRHQREHYEPTSNTESSSHPPGSFDDDDDDDEDDDDERVVDVMEEEYYEDGAIAPNNNIHERHSTSDPVLNIDDSGTDNDIVTVPFGDVAIATTTTTTPPYNNDDDHRKSSHTLPDLPTIT